MIEITNKAKNKNMTSEKIPFTVIQKEVDKVVSVRVHKEICNFVKANPPSLWASQKPRNFLEKNVTLALYKDISGIGYKRLHQMVDIGSTWTHKCLLHNIQVLRPIMKQWGNSKLHLGFVEDWKMAAHFVRSDSILKSPTLWMDSSDWGLQKWRGCSTKKAYWSYKCNRPARRFMFLQDGKSRIRKMWGGYSPKVHDSTWLEMHKEWIVRHLNGARILADNHFSWGTKNISDPIFLTPKKKPSKKRKRDKEDIEVLTIEQQKWNSAVHSSRARVETPFGIFQNLFGSLKNPWAEDQSQLEFLIYIAAGIHNAKIA